MNQIKLQAPRNIVSPRVGKQWDSVAPIRLGDAGFEEALFEVKDCVRMAEQGHWPAEYLAKGNPSGLDGAMPELIKKELRISGTRATRNLALSVSMDDYWDLGIILLRELKSRGVEWKNHRPDTVQFCDSDSSDMVFMKDLISRISKSMDKTFDVKYFWEQPRPEDYAEIHGSVFTVDKLGAPGHWAFWAGHATAAGTTTSVLADHMKLSNDLHKQVMHDAFTFAFGRAPLGVHFLKDNEHGFNSGLTF